MRKARWIPTIVGAGLLILALAPAAEAQKTVRKPTKPTSGVSGSSTFKSYCTPCHGADAKGGGPAAKALKSPPADLTRIATRHGGQFPDAEVRQIILGDHELAAHGTRDMPIWGPMFRSADGASVSDLRVKNLVQYLKSIQKK
jgi:mono/diheme cytochrome c family protein